MLSSPLVLFLEAYCIPWCLVWECIAHLEMIGSKVPAADGASPNCKFFKLHSNGSKATFTNKTTNIIDSEKKVEARDNTARKNNCYISKKKICTV